MIQISPLRLCYQGYDIWISLYSYRDCVRYTNSLAGIVSKTAQQTIGCSKISLGPKYVCVGSMSGPLL